jgi:hypothetical protein
MPISNALESAWEFSTQRLRRLRTGLAPAVAFAALAILCRNLELLPDRMATAQRIGLVAFFVHWLVNNFIEACVIATILLLSLRISAPTGTDMTRNPVRFFGVLTLGGTMAALAAWEIGVWLDVLPGLLTPNMTWDRFYGGWVATLLWGCLFGWMYVLYLQRREDQLRLTVVLGQRSLLTRLLVQSQLAAARAQIEPELVVRVLRVVHQRYGTSPGAASDLMDHLIDYLRLVLNRVREQRPLLVNELALIRSYLALHEAETGRHIPFETTVAQEHVPAESTFVVARRLIRATNELPGVQATLCLATHTQHIAIDLGTGSIPFGPELIARVSAELAEFGTGAGGSILQRTADPHSHWYTVNVPIH